MINQEQGVVVDRDDNVLEFKNRDDITPNDIWRMVLVWIENEAGEVLMTRRALTKKIFPGMWEPAAAGGVIAHESYQDAAQRELAEETGLTGIDLMHVTTTYLDIGEHGQRMIGWFRGVTDKSLSDLVLEEGAVMDAGFFDKAELVDKAEANPGDYPPSSVYWRQLFS